MEVPYNNIATIVRTQERYKEPTGSPNYVTLNIMTEAFGETKKLDLSRNAIKQYLKYIKNVDKWSDDMIDEIYSDIMQAARMSQMSSEELSQYKEPEALKNYNEIFFGQNAIYLCLFNLVKQVRIPTDPLTKKSLAKEGLKNIIDENTSRDFF